MARLSVNLNKIALLRNSRRTGVPDVLRFGRIAHDAGADGLTAHPRPDERHIRRDDVFGLAELMRPWRPGFELNLEGYPDRRFLDIVAAGQARAVHLGARQPRSLHLGGGLEARHRAAPPGRRRARRAQAARLPRHPVHRSRPRGGRAGAQHRGRRHRDLHRFLRRRLSAGATMRRCCAPAPPPPNAPPNWASSSISATI